MINRTMIQNVSPHTLAGCRSVVMSSLWMMGLDLNKAQDVGSLERTLQLSFPLIARVMGNKNKVRVRFADAATASTDGQVITLPQITLRHLAGDRRDFVNDQAYREHIVAVFCIVMVLALALLYHEIAHVRYTRGYEARLQATKFGFTILNIVEDVRIERRQSIALPGSGKLIALGEHLIHELICPPAPTPDSDPGRVLLSFLLNNLRRDQLNQYAPNADAARYAMVSIFQPMVTHEIEELAKAATHANSTFEANQYVDQIMALLQSLAKNQETSANDSNEVGDNGEPSDAPQTGDNPSEDAQSSESDGDQKGQKPSESEKGSAKSGGDSEPDGSNATDSGVNNGKNAGSQLEKNGQNNSGSSGSQSEGVSSEVHLSMGQRSAGNKISEEKLKAMLVGDASEYLESDLGALLSSLLPSLQVNSHLNGQGSIFPMNYLGEIATADRFVLERNTRLVAHALSGRIEELLYTKTRSRRFIDEQGAKLVRSRVARIVAGDLRVFESKVQGADLDTAIAIAVDFSGSMGKPLYRRTGSAGVVEEVSVAEVTHAAVSGIAHVLDEIDVPLSIVGFDDDLYECKLVDVPWSSAKRYFRAVAGGYTYTAPAIHRVASDLVSSGKQRKVILIVTDGIPSDTDDTKEAISFVRKMGIDIEVRVVLIGMGEQDMTPYDEILPKHHVCRANNHRELPKAIFSVLEHELI